MRLNALGRARPRRHACGKRAHLLENRRNSGNIASSISVLLLEAALLPEQQGDAPMKIILVGVAFATFMVLPLSTPSRKPPKDHATSQGLSGAKKAITKHLGAAIPRPRRVRVELQSQPASNADPHQATAVQYSTRFLSRLPWRQWRLKPGDSGAVASGRISANQFAPVRSRSCTGGKRCCLNGEISRYTRAACDLR